MSRRSHVNKRESSRKFSRQVDYTKAINVAPPPMRGGIRL